MKQNLDRSDAQAAEASEWTIKLKGWKITTEHPHSSYGIPVLVAPDGKAYGPEDEVDVKGIPALRASSLAKELHTIGLATEAQWMRFATMGEFDNYAKMLESI